MWTRPGRRTPAREHTPRLQPSAACRRTGRLVVSLARGPHVRYPRMVVCPSEPQRVGPPEGRSAQQIAAAGCRRRTAAFTYRPPGCTEPAVDATRAHPCELATAHPRAER